MRCWNDFNGTFRFNIKMVLCWIYVIISKQCPWQTYSTLGPCIISTWISSGLYLILLLVNWHHQQFKICSIGRHYEYKISLNRFEWDRMYVRNNLATSPKKFLRAFLTYVKSNMLQRSQGCVYWNDRGKYLEHGKLKLRESAEIFYFMFALK